MIIINVEHSCAAGNDEIFIVQKVQKNRIYFKCLYRHLWPI